MCRRLFFLAMLSAAAFTGGPLHAQSHGPLLSVTPSPVDFDTVFCGTSRCMEVLFRNDGDTALTIQSFDALVSPFQGALPAPLTLAPGESRAVEWCYTPTRIMTRDSVSVRFISDNRIPYSIGFLVDVSSSMGVALPGATTAIQAARAALGGFVGTMMADGAPSHEGAVFTYSTSSAFRLLRGLTEQRSQVEGALPGTASGPHACVWHGMDRGISLMAAAKHRQVLVVVNGSEDAGVGSCGPYSAPGVASAALAADMIVCAISVNGAAQGPLADIASQTGGVFRSVASASELAQAMDDIVLHLQRAVQQQLVVRGEVVSPALAFSRDALLFPTTRAGDTARVTVWLRNVGTAPMDLGRVEGETGAFRLTMTPRQVPPGDSIAAELAYHPSAEGYEQTAVSVAVNGCVPGGPELRLHGLCYEDNNPSLGPVLAHAPRDIDAGRLPCDTGGELIVPMRNAGDAVLDAFMPLVQHSRVLPPAQGSWQIAANSEIPISLQLQPGGVPGPDSCGFAVSVRTRRTASTVVLVDAASSLRVPWQGLEGTAMAQLLVGGIASGLGNTPEIRDSMAVISAGKENVVTLLGYTADRDQLASLAPLPGSSDTTALLDGINRALDLLSGRDGLR
ncbi:MAG: choice-of-anchor D domain-containing protein, partial [Bacteroidetes bacterium]|nr:choice-of-anchor D domain-containing protein [Bacteroidota bacterium]